MSYVRNIFTTALFLTACVFLISLVYKPLQIPSLIEGEVDVYVNTVELKDRIIRVDIADTPEKREAGLSGRESLAQDEGMLFVFPEDGIYAFWMKDMRFSIDILWISHAGMVVELQKSVSPETYPATFVPSKDARYVLELPSGWIEAHIVEIGDIVHL